MNPENLRVEAADGVATVTIARPEKLNALNAAVMAELGDCAARLAADATVRVVVVTGAGEKAFVAGADIAELERNSALAQERTSAAGQRTLFALERMGKPVIAAINGFALGGGLELAMACTLRTAARTARLGLPEITLGILPGYGGTQRLARLIGLGRALEMLLTGGMIGAEEAQRIGLVNRVFEPAELMDGTMGLAGKLAAQAPVATRLILEAVHRGASLPLDEGCAVEAALFGLVSSTADTREGLRAFLEKRKPVFTGT